MWLYSYAYILFSHASCVTTGLWLHRPLLYIDQQIWLHGYLHIYLPTYLSICMCCCYVCIRSLTPTVPTQDFDSTHRIHVYRCKCICMAIYWYTCLFICIYDLSHTPPVPALRTSTLLPMLTSARPPTQAWEVARTVVAPPPSPVAVEWFACVFVCGVVVVCVCVRLVLCLTGMWL